MKILSEFESGHEKPIEAQKEDKSDSIPPLFLTDLEQKPEINRKEDQSSIEKINLLYLAYYNCGIENDCIGKIEKGISLLHIASNMHSFLAKECGIEKKDEFENVCEKAMAKMEKRKKKLLAFRESKAKISLYIPLNKEKILSCKSSNFRDPFLKRPLKMPLIKINRSIMHPANNKKHILNLIFSPYCQSARNISRITKIVGMPTPT